MGEWGAVSGEGDIRATVYNVAYMEYRLLVSSTFYVFGRHIRLDLILLNGVPNIR